MTARTQPLPPADLRNRLEVDGYAVVPLLDAASLAEVKAILERFGPAPGDPRTGLFNDTWSPDLVYRRELSAALTAVMEPAARAVLPDARFLAWTSIVKWGGPDGAVVAHRDATFVDEPAVRSTGIWCALDDLDADDGSLVVLPGSHHGAPNVRPHQDEGNLYPSVILDGSDPSVAITLPAGSALIYDHALIHGSDAIDAGRVRTVIAGLAVPRDAVTWYAVHAGDDVVLVEIDPAFFLEHKIDALDVDGLLQDHRIVRRLPPPPR